MYSTWLADFEPFMHLHSQCSPEIVVLFWPMGLKDLAANTVVEQLWSYTSDAECLAPLVAKTIYYVRSNGWSCNSMTPNTLILT